MTWRSCDRGARTRACRVGTLPTPGAMRSHECERGTHECARHVASSLLAFAFASPSPVARCPANNKISPKSPKISSMDPWRCRRSAATSAGYHEHNGVRLDEKLDDLTPSGIQEQRQFYFVFRDRLGLIKPESLSPEERADYQIIQNQIDLAQSRSAPHPELSPQSHRVCGAYRECAIQSLRSQLRAARNPLPAYYPAALPDSGLP